MIAGIFSDKEIFFKDIESMSVKMFHRGPDREGYKFVGTGWMGHGRLSIIDLSDKGNQPMESDRYVLTMNSEIYNYKELESYLDEKGGNDCRVFLNYIERFGIKKSLADSNGMFSFGLYDMQTNLLTLGVDRFAQKPLYYYHDDKLFAFASTPNALLWIKDKWKINEEAMQSYWLLGGVMGGNSMFDGIKRLNASEMLTFDPQTGKSWKDKYWEPRFQENTTGIEDIVLDSIRKVKVSDVPVHIFLSGGIDSTLVASQCPEFGAIHLDGPEKKYAEQVCNKFGNKLIIVDPYECDPVVAMTDYVTKCGFPSMAALQVWMLSKEVSKFGKVAISANAGDELFFGYTRTHQDYTDMRSLFRYALLDYPEHVFPFETKGSWYAKQGRWMELMAYVQYDLNTTLDAASMSHSLEVRTPFLDHRLVEMALSIDEKTHRNEYGDKSILKRMLKKMGFDDHFITRNKLGFSIFKEPHNLSVLQEKSLNWCTQKGFIKLHGLKLTPRDKRYLQASAFSFQCWYNVFKDKLI